MKVTVQNKVARFYGSRCIVGTTAYLADRGTTISTRRS